MRLFDVAARQAILSWVAVIYLAALGFTVLACGSVSEAPLSLSVIAFALLTGVSLIRPTADIAIGRKRDEETVARAWSPEAMYPGRT